MIEQHPLHGREIELAPGRRIGRESCEILLLDPAVSRRHALIRQLDCGLAIEDLQSSNGTWVNERRIAGITAICAGDRLRFGNTVGVVRDARVS